MRQYRSLETFDSYIDNYLVPQKKTFTLTEYNGRKTVVWDKQKNFGGMYRNPMTADEMKWMWVFSAVQRCCKTWLAKNGKPNELAEPFNAISRNWNEINKLKKGDIFKYTDIDHCFWRIAYLNGYISKVIYEKCLLPKNHPHYEITKNFRNKALACISSVKTRHFFVDGEYVESETEVNDGLVMIYNDIRNKAYSIMDGAKSLMEDGFIMYRVDGIYYHPKHQKKVEKHIRAFNLTCKTQECETLDNTFFLIGDELKTFR